MIYDKNALDLGLTPDGDWFKWHNAKALARYQPTIVQRVTSVAVPLVLTAATTAILFRVHATQAAPQGLIYFYLMPLILIAIIYTERIALMSAGVALVCGDYFLQDPIFSFYASEYRDLIWFGALAPLAIMATRKIFRRGDAA